MVINNLFMWKVVIIKIFKCSSFFDQKATIIYFMDFRSFCYVFVNKDKKDY